MKYDKNYYEYGLETGVSNYQNYRWIPELTIPMAMTIIDFLGIKPFESVLDYGCAKGYLVKALRMLRRDAWGCDISDYALSEAFPDTSPFLVNLNDTNGICSQYFKYGICKDVLEHIPQEKLVQVLLHLNVDVLFSIVPLGNGIVYTAKANNLDATHIICEDMSWWFNIFELCGWHIYYFSDRVEGIKDSYGDTPNAHLFTILRRTK